jgi:glutamate--cysteine ligase catalytic subunit
LQRAHEIDAVRDQKFWFRKNIVKPGQDHTKNPASAKDWSYHTSNNDASDDSEDNFVEMTISEILEGSQEHSYFGLIPLIRQYMEIHRFSEEDHEFYDTMLNFLCRRARGEIKTGARFMRDLVLNHPAYEQDSVVNNQI